MDKLRAIHLFTRLAELGSYTALAAELKLAKSSISKEISKLENEIGARLIQRSTRRFALTPIGEEYLARCGQILQMVAAAETAVHEMQLHPKGSVRVNAPMALGILELPGLFAQFMRQYPGIQLDICFDDRPVDLLEGGFDLAFRASSRPIDVNYFGKQLATFNYRVVSSAQYLAGRPAIESERDLVDHPCFVYSYFQNNNNWPLGEGIRVNGPLKANSAIFMLRLIEQGFGIGFMPDFICRDSLAAGRSLEILPHVERPQLTLYALYPSHHHVSHSVRLLLDFAENWFAAGVPIAALQGNNQTRR